MSAGESMSAEQFRRSQGGARAQRGGQDFEASLGIAHDFYRLHGVADISKLPVETAPCPGKWLAKGERPGRFRILAERQRADYFGWSGVKSILPGRAVLMEAKANAKRVASLGIIAHEKKGHGLKEFQLKSLAEAHEAGAISALVWKNGDDRHVVTGPQLARFWYEYRMQRLTRIPAAGADLFGVVGYESCSEVEDWLPVAASAAQGAR